MYKNNPLLELFPDVWRWYEAEEWYDRTARGEDQSDNGHDETARAKVSVV